MEEILLYRRKPDRLVERVGRKDTLLDRGGGEVGAPVSGQRIIGYEICIGKSREPLKSSGLKGGFI